MSIQIAAAGNGFQQQDFSPERVPAFMYAETRAAQPKEPPSAAIQSAMAELEQVSLAFSKKLKFVVDHQSHEVTVKVIDPQTDKVIKILPPEELQRLHRRLKETIGVLFDEMI